MGINSDSETKDDWAHNLLRDEACYHIKHHKQWVNIKLTNIKCTKICQPLFDIFTSFLSWIWNMLWTITWQGLANVKSVPDIEELMKLEVTNKVANSSSINLFVQNVDTINYFYELIWANKTVCNDSPRAFTNLKTLMKTILLLFKSWRLVVIKFQKEKK